MRPRTTGGVAWAVAILMVVTGCGRSSPPPDAPSSDAPSAAAGPTTVNGTERLNWLQPGDMPYLSYFAYVDGQPVSLDDATCTWATAEVHCDSPLPPMSDGVHTIALAAKNPFSGQEGPQSGAITVQKVSARSVVSAVWVPNTGVASNDPRSAAATASYGGDAFSVDVIARGLRGPLQLASTPDGRLLIAEGDTGVRVIRPGLLESPDRALDAQALLRPPPAGGLGLAVHPDFARNHFVYVSFLSREGAEKTLLRIVRLREVGDTLGEPLSLFEAPVLAVPETSRPADNSAAPSAAVDRLGDSPRLAFGPDGLLYSLLPLGFEFDNEPAASRPHASMLRVDDDGRAPRVGPLTDIIAHPLGFAWHPSTAALWLIFPGGNGETLVRPSGVSSAAGIAAVERGVLRLAEGAASSSGALVLNQAGALDLARTFLQGIDPESIGVLRLVMPVLAESVLDGVPGRITDVVPAGAGTLYVTTSDASASSSGSDAVLRLTLRVR